MRWLALLLLLVNIFLFWWLSSLEGDKVRSVDVGKLPRVSEIELIDQQARQGERPATQEPVPGPTTAGSGPGDQETDDVMASEPSNRLDSGSPCYGIGWFAEADMALEYQRTLLQGVPSLSYRGLHEKREALEPFHWVIIPPLSSRDEAMDLYRDLVDAGVEAYVVPSGENENAISLGLFRSRDSAERVLNERQAENIDATLVKFPRNRISYALVFGGVPESPLRDQGIPPAEREAELQLIEFSDCEGVATAEKNP
ncbi:SPOR domain-containing protein [Marinobacter bryozoorum]|uniref:SPOR domain-containing protein n=1 Tax=Marinobacter bryozoorum TaxID=256324 RepID=UPI002006082B|nr:SPOR domain-containing protein [Marinobacter bryozoorum]MCK7545696.1 SPOR domain-containing protein [Marinobacter bryozoorum]